MVTGPAEKINAAGNKPPKPPPLPEQKQQKTRTPCCCQPFGNCGHWKPVTNPSPTGRIRMVLPLQPENRGHQWRRYACSENYPVLRLNVALYNGCSRVPISSVIGSKTRHAWADVIHTALSCVSFRNSARISRSREMLPLSFVWSRSSPPAFATMSVASH